MTTAFATRGTATTRASGGPVVADRNSQVEYRRPLDNNPRHVAAKPNILRQAFRPSALGPIVLGPIALGPTALGPSADVCGDTTSLIEAFDAGELSKPRDLHALLARVEAALRQLDNGSAGPARQSERRHFRFCGWKLDTRTRRLTDPAGTPVALTKGEYTLLLALLNAPQRPLSREFLLRATHVHEDAFDRSIDVQILRLRRKLERGPDAPRIIQTERGVGYVFAVPVERV